MATQELGPRRSSEFDIAVDNLPEQLIVQLGVLEKC